MHVPFNAPLRVYESQKQETEAAIRRVLESGHYLLGPCLTQFERDLEIFWGSGIAIGCNSGTDALVLALKSLAIGAGDEVILPAHTAIPTVTAVITVGAKPVFCDIDPETWVMSVASARSFITARTKAIIPVHLYGNMVEMPELLKLGIPVIEDVAQAMGSKLDEKPAGLFGDLGAFSFYPTKNLGALGDAGAVVASTQMLASKVRQFRFYGQSDRYMAALEGGINSRLDEIQAAILSVRMHKLRDWIIERRAIMDFYRSELSGLPITFQRVTAKCEPAWHLAVIALEQADKRDLFLDHLGNKRIGALVHYPTPCHLQPAFSAYRTAALPFTENLCKKIVSLPLYPGLLPKELEHIALGVRAFFS
jgi:dTDP-4-amino-4,6-dideoxygalactose transaminase